MDSLSVKQLADGCANRQPDKTHEQYCFELFRRAITDKDNVCWSAIYTQYYDLCCKWAIDVCGSSDGVGSLEIDDVVSIAYANFWKTYDEAHLKQSDQHLGKVLAFLRACVVSTVLSEGRRNQRHNVIVEEINMLPIAAKNSKTEDDVLSELWGERVWKIVERLCRTEQERVVARASFVWGFTPKRIMKHFPTLFEKAEDISMLRKNLRERLTRDTDLNAIWDQD